MEDKAEDPESAPREDRLVISLNQGTRVCLVLSTLLLLVAAYLFWGPLGREVANNFPAKCGSAARPPGDTLGKSVCGTINAERRAQALTAVGAALIVAVGGVFAFGVTPVPSRRTPPTS